MDATFPVIVDGLYRQGSHNLAVSLVAENGQPLPAWTPGAHIDLHLANGLVRPYSLTGCAANQAQYLICVARDPASRGGSRYIHDQLRPGQRLMISPPRNGFPLACAPRVILLAAGIGITPLYSMAEHLEASGVPFSLHYYVRQPGNAAFCTALSREFRHGDCAIYYSTEGNSPRNSPPPVLDQYQPGTLLYLCGPQGFMAGMAHYAREKGWPEADIRTEAFSPPVAVASGTGRCFVVTCASTGQQWPVAEDQTIARVLLDNGIPVPLSCEMGMCGACLTPVLSGEVDHRDTVQSEAEKTAPRQHIALCCSRSYSGELVLDL